MSTDKRLEGIAIRCDWGGVVLEILRDELELGSTIQPGQSFTALVNRESLDKARAFLAALRAQRATFDWEMNVHVQERIMSLHFAGGSVNSELFIVGSPSRTGVTRFYDEMLQINNEQANALRQTMKELFLRTPRPERESELYDELTRLNNELVTAQRELAKKNIELARLNDEKNQFLGIAAHDLRNPLGVILAYSHFLLDEAAPVLNEEQMGFLKRIKSSSNFMLNLVNNLLDISVIEAGKLQLNLAPVDLSRPSQRKHLRQSGARRPQAGPADARKDGPNAINDARPREDRAGSQQPARQRHKVLAGRRRGTGLARRLG